MELPASPPWDLEVELTKASLDEHWRVGAQLQVYAYVVGCDGDRPGVVEEVPPEPVGGGSS